MMPCAGTSPNHCAMLFNIYPKRPINSFDIQYPLSNIQYISNIPQRPIWSGRYSTLILLCRRTHSRSSTNITSPILPESWKRGGDFVRNPKIQPAPNVTSLTEGVHESCADTSKCSTGMQQLHMLRLLVFPNLARHQQCVLTSVAWLSFLSSTLVKTSGTPLTGRTWIVVAIPVKFERAATNSIYLLPPAPEATKSRLRFHQARHQIEATQLFSEP